MALMEAGEEEGSSWIRDIYLTYHSQSIEGREEVTNSCGSSAVIDGAEGT